ncbi:MAG: hypothetical protein LBI53_03545 [Candidatus Peribacteria bacterium]|jgi:hypothetical protein|nr:hypothetical protein [Candidatus Peribacteria bacterium]
MSSSGERGTTSYREVPKALTPQDQVDQLLSQIDSLDNNPDLKNHKPILEKIQKVLKAGEKATEEDIKVLQKGLQGNEVLKKNEKLHDAFLKEAFTEKE